MFVGLNRETIENIKYRLESELKDKEIPYQRKEEVISLIKYADVWIKDKEVNE